MKKQVLTLCLLLVNNFIFAEVNKNVALIYGQDFVTASSYKTLLDSYGFAVTLVDQNSVVGYNFSPFKVIIASGNSNNGGNYTTWIDNAHVDAVKTSGLPVVGICSGGGALLFKLGAFNNGGQAAGISSSTIKLKQLTVPAFNTPLTVTIASDSTVNMINTSICSQGTYIGGSYPSSFSLWSIVKQDVQYSAINSDSSKFYFFGYDANSVSDFTDEGKKIFVNLVYQAGSFNFNVVTDLPSPLSNLPTRHSFPNPTRGQLFINDGLLIQKVQVVDLQGNVVLELNNPGTKVDISNLAVGVYFAKFTTTEGHFTEKILKE